MTINEVPPPIRIVYVPGGYLMQLLIGWIVVFVTHVPVPIYGPTVMIITGSGNLFRSNTSGVGDGVLSGSGVAGDG